MDSVCSELFWLLSSYNKIMFPYFVDSREMATGEYFMNFQFSGNKFVKSMKAQKSMKLVKILLLSTGPGCSLLSWLLQHSERQKTKKWQYF